MNTVLKTSLTLLLLLTALATTTAALSSAGPVDPLPTGPTRAIVATAPGSFVVTLPKSKQPGLVWRVARIYRSSVIREQSEGETASTVWLRYETIAPGKTSLVFAFTRGERPHAFAARTFRITVR
jgi:hypothetical protein